MISIELDTSMTVRRPYLALAVPLHIKVICCNTNAMLCWVRAKGVTPAKYTTYIHIPPCSWQSGSRHLEVSAEMTDTTSDNIIAPLLPRLRLLNRPPVSEADLEVPHAFYWDSLLETQVAAVRILNAYPNANLDQPLLSRLAYVISVRIPHAWHLPSI